MCLCERARAFVLGCACNIVCVRVYGGGGLQSACGAVLLFAHIAHNVWCGEGVAHEKERTKHVKAVAYGMLLPSNSASAVASRLATELISPGDERLYGALGPSTCVCVSECECV